MPLEPFDDTPPGNTGLLHAPRTAANSPVAAASLTNVTVSGLKAGDSFGGRTLVLADKILLAGQTVPAQNGQYTVGAESCTRVTTATLYFYGAEWRVTAGTLAGKTVIQNNSSTSAPTYQKDTPDTLAGTIGSWTNDPPDNIP